MPLDRIEFVSSSSAVSVNLVLGWYGLGSSKSMSTMSGAPVTAGAGAVAAAAEAVLVAATSAG